MSFALTPPAWVNSALERLSGNHQVSACSHIPLDHSAFPKYAESQNNEFAVVAALQIESDFFEVLVCFRHDFPLVLPKIFLLNWRAHRGRPHVEYEKEYAWICYVREEQVVSDASDPQRAFDDIFDRLVSALKSGRQQSRAGEFIEEFELYWSKLPSSTSVACSIDDLSCPSVINYWLNAKGKIVLVGNGRAHKLAKERRYKPSKNAGVYIPLNRLNLAGFNHYDRFHPGKLQELIGMPRQWPRSVLKALPDRIQNTHLLVFGWEKAPGKKSLFGAQIQTNGQGHPLLDHRVWRRLRPLTMLNENSDVLARRGGTDTGLSDKRVLIVGCGSLGGTTAMMLAKAGLGSLTLVDKDRLEALNVQRHILGKDHVGKAKVDALKEALENGANQIKVTALNRELNDLLRDTAFNFQSFDAIVLSTGSHNVDRLMNAYLWRHRIATPCFIHWVEGYGLGGHVVASRYNDHEVGCLECLFTRDSVNANFQGCLLSFTEAGQIVREQLPGCGGSFTPFGFLDSIRYSELLSRRVVSTLLGEWDGFVADSIKGDAASALAAGISLSSRYNLSQHEIDAARRSWAKSRCRVCAGGAVV